MNSNTNAITLVDAIKIVVADMIESLPDLDADQLIENVLQAGPDEIEIDLDSNTKIDQAYRMITRTDGAHVWAAFAEAYPGVSDDDMEHCEAHGRQLAVNGVAETILLACGCVIDNLPICPLHGKQEIEKLWHKATELSCGCALDHMTNEWMH